MARKNEDASPGTTDPGSGATGINNLGQIAGWYYSNSTTQGGFLDNGGTFTTFPPPAGFPCCGITGMNDSGLMVGRANNGSTEYGFVMNGGTTTSLSVPGYRFNGANGINNAGQVVGEESNLIGQNDAVGFLYSGGIYTTFGVPGSTKTEGIGINDNAQMVGFYCTTFSCNAGTVHGFFDNSGTFTSIDVPGASQTIATGINNLGQIVGYSYDSLGLVHGYVDNGGILTTIDVPGASATAIDGINDAGQIVGHYYVGTNGVAIAFVASPVPTPAAFWLFGSGFLGLLGAAKRRKQ